MDDRRRPRHRPHRPGPTTDTPNLVQAANRPAPARGRTVVSDPAALLRLEPLPPFGTVRLVHLAG
ncbi:hypothetical protein [Streptomyces sp. NBC_00347]|uniref:hypothetical protein n=1 Tax=Streptomyces sp. NBC_00347 TaxID=2975721 RepID=UPI00225450AD|nr:hypothetical protein [Streptomyces sp. NBC_00347]MCX5129965.1 hypothetical protein [Streptomyces sp. NBC_00347]